MTHDCSESIIWASFGKSYFEKEHTFYFSLLTFIFYFVMSLARRYLALVLASLLALVIIHLPSSSYLHCEEFMP